MPILRMAALLALMIGHCTAKMVHWNNNCCSRGRVWDDASCWTGGVSPAAGDDVVFANPVMNVLVCGVSYASSQRIASLTVVGAVELRISATMYNEISADSIKMLDSAAKLSWTNGTLRLLGTSSAVQGKVFFTDSHIVGTGVLKIEELGEVEFMQVSTLFLTRMLVTVYNYGSLTLNGKGFVCDGTLYNYGMMFLKVTEDVTSNGGVWQNHAGGKITVSLSSNSLQPSLINDGSFHVDMDTSVKISKAGTGSGIFHVNPGGVLRFEGGYTFGSKTEFTGGGRFLIDSSGRQTKVMLAGKLRVPATMTLISSAQIVGTMEVHSAMVLQDAINLYDSRPAITGAPGNRLAVRGVGTLTRSQVGNAFERMYFIGVNLATYGAGRISLTYSTFDRSTVDNYGSLVVADSVFLGVNLTNQASAFINLTSVSISSVSIFNYGTILMYDRTFAVTSALFNASSPPAAGPPNHELIIAIQNLEGTGRVEVMGHQVEESVARAFGAGSVYSKVSATGTGEVCLWGGPASAGHHVVSLWVTIPQDSQVALLLESAPAHVSPSLSLAGPVAMHRGLVVCYGQCLVHGSITVLDSSAIEGSGALVSTSLISFDPTAPSGTSPTALRSLSCHACSCRAQGLPGSCNIAAQIAYSDELCIHLTRDEGCGRRDTVRRNQAREPRESQPVQGQAQRGGVRADAGRGCA
jgi:hypothetical protein